MAISFNSLGGYGRLGNQMFQYASLRGIAHHQGYEFCIPAVGHRLFDLFEMKNCQVRDSNKIVMQSLTHEGFDFDKNLFQNCPDYTDLYGYFQSEKYFENIIDSVREDFTFKQKDDSKMDMLRSLAEGREVVGIHVRRGDYLGLEDYHPTLSTEYYHSAKNVFNKVVFAVFSDDLEWCKEQKVFEDCVLMDTADDTALHLMSQCDHNIIANSSFSWWAAWLNKNNHKIVIAPNKWFGPAYKSYVMSDLLPARWISL